MNYHWAILLSCCLCITASTAAPFSLIICGSGGQEEYQQRFNAWGERLRTVLQKDMQHPADHIILLTADHAEQPASQQSIAAAVANLRHRLTPADDLFIYLIGHGNYRDGTAKLNLPGPDLSATDLGHLMARVNVRHLILVNAASASAPFINVLSAPNRLLCTSTKSADQRDATWFMEYFLQGLESGSADRNRDGRITALEACSQAAVLTQSHYTTARLIPTEHALLDDNGDGLGVRLPLADSLQTDGALAATIYLKDFHYPPNTPPQQIQAYRTALDQVEHHIRRKQELPVDEYYQRLEEFLLEAARINQRIQGGNY